MPLNSKLKKIQGLFKDLPRNLRTFQGKIEFKVFLRTSPKIQELFKNGNHGTKNIKFGSEQQKLASRSDVIARSKFDCESSFPPNILCLATICILLVEATS